MEKHVICDYICKDPEGKLVRIQWIKPPGEDKYMLSTPMENCAYPIKKKVLADGFYDMINKPEDDYFFSKEFIQKLKPYFNVRIGRQR